MGWNRINPKLTFLTDLIPSLVGWWMNLIWIGVSFLLFVLFRLVTVRSKGSGMQICSSKLITINSMQIIPEWLSAADGHKWTFTEGRKWRVLDYHDMSDIWSTIPLLSTSSYWCLDRKASLEWSFWANYVKARKEDWFNHEHHHDILISNHVRIV